MKFNAIRDFLAVVERGSLRAAARQTGGSQPAMSRSIQELERELGVVLFERRGTGVRLTPMGEVFLRRASSVHNELRQAREELQQLRGETRGRLTVALSSVAHLALLPGALGPLRQRYPLITLDILDAVFPDVEAALRDSRIDCYIGPLSAPAGPELLVEKLFDSTRRIVGRKGHPLENARSLGDLVDAEWISSSITHAAQDELGPLFARHGLPPPQIRVQLHSTLSHLVVLACSDLLMMLPAPSVQSPLLRGRLSLVDVRELLPSPPICLVYRAGSPLTPAAEYFCDMMRRAAWHMDGPDR